MIGWGDHAGRILNVRIKHIESMVVVQPLDYTSDRNKKEKPVYALRTSDVRYGF